MSDTVEVIKKPNSSIHKLTALDVQNDIINRLSKNDSGCNIAKDYNVSEARISQLKTKHENEIEINRNKLIECLPTALEIVQQDLKNGKGIAFRYTYNRKSITEEDLTYKKQIQTLTSDLFKMLGYFPHTNTSLHIGKFYQDNRIQSQISPEFLAFQMFQANNQAEIPDSEAEYKESQEENKP